MTSSVAYIKQCLKRDLHGVEFVCDVNSRARHTLLSSEESDQHLVMAWGLGTSWLMPNFGFQLRIVGNPDIDGTWRFTSAR